MPASCWVAADLARSLLDNVESMLGNRPAFGLVSIDRETFAHRTRPRA
jgi:hypothetical protein